jgi:hypothetical protein
LRELELTRPPTRSELLRDLRGQLHAPPFSVQVVATGILGLDATIDWLGVGPDRRIVLGFLCEEREDLAFLANALTQRAWAEPRVRDWLQLAPHLEVAPEAGVRLLLVGPDFGVRARSLVESLEPVRIDLVRYLCIRNGSGVSVLLEPVRCSASACAPGRIDRPAPIEPAFRTGLSDSELGLTSAERLEFEP